VLDIIDLIVGAERAENRVERSGAVSEHCRKWCNRRSRSGNRWKRSEERGLQKYRFERGAAILPLTLRSHAVRLNLKNHSDISLIAPLIFTGGWVKSAKFGLDFRPRLHFSRPCYGMQQHI